MDPEKRKKFQEFQEAVAKAHLTGRLKDGIYEPELQRTNNINQEIPDSQPSSYVETKTVPEPEPEIKNNHINPINPKSKNKYNLVEEYFTLCDCKGVNTLTNSELKKIKIKDLEQEIIKINKYPDIQTKNKELKIKQSNTGEHFYNINWFLAYSAPIINNYNNSYEIDNDLHKKIAEHKEPLKQIGSEIFEENPELLEYIDNPYFKLAGIWGLAAWSSVKKKEKILTTNQLPQEKTEKQIEEEMF